MRQGGKPQGHMLRPFRILAAAAGGEDRIAAYCAALVQGSPRALAGAKELLARPAPADLRAELAALSELSTGYFLSEEGLEGVMAFREKRPARWVPAAE